MILTVERMGYYIECLVKIVKFLYCLESGVYAYTIWKSGNRWKI